MEGTARGGPIRAIRSHPLRVQLPAAQMTSQGRHTSVDILVVEVETEDGIIGIGEGLARQSSATYAGFVDDVLSHRLIGRESADRRALWQIMRRALTGRTGGQLVEAISAIDIALWDIAGKAAGQPIHRLLGGIGRTEVDAYASSINWVSDDAAAIEINTVLKAGFQAIKIKLGRPVHKAIERAKLARRLAGDGISLLVDANWAYDLHEAIQVGRVLSDLGYDVFEEPIHPDDRGGYRLLSRQLPIRLAAGESDYCAADALELLSDRAVGLIQPDVTRSGGITETWRIAELAAAHHVAYAPHVGWSGGICTAASLHLAAAAESFHSYECMVFPNPLRQALTSPVVGDVTNLIDGRIKVPQGPGLGVEFDPAALERFTIRKDAIHG